MTDELNGPELALAVAKVLGKAVTEYCGNVHEIEGIHTDHTANTRTVEISNPWRPDLGGAAGAEVLEWLASQQGEHSPIAIFHPCYDDPMWTVLVFAHEIEAPTLWIALCRAVVEVGGEG